MGSEQFHAVESLLFQALVHMLKAEGWPLARDLENWRADARGFRARRRTGLLRPCGGGSIWTASTARRCVRCRRRWTASRHRHCPKLPATLDELLSDAAYEGARAPDDAGTRCRGAIAVIEAEQIVQALFGPSLTS